MSTPEDGNLAYDTERQYIGTVYAKGLLGVAEKAGNKPQVIEELQSLVHEVLPRLPKLKLLLESPRVPLPVKADVIDRAFGSASSEFVRFLKVVCEHGRFDCLRVIAATALKRYRDEIEQVEVTVTTATELADDQRERLVGRLGEIFKQEIVLRSQVDPEILGGLVVRIGDTVFDGSIANQLHRVRQTAADRAMQQIRQSLDRFAVEA